MNVCFDEANLVSLPFYSSWFGGKAAFANWITVASASSCAEVVSPNGRLETNLDRTFSKKKEVEQMTRRNRRLPFQVL